MSRKNVCKFFVACAGLTGHSNSDTKNASRKFCDQKRKSQKFHVSLEINEEKKQNKLLVEKPSYYDHESYLLNWNFFQSHQIEQEK